MCVYRQDDFIDKHVYSWLYRIRPSVVHKPYAPFKHDSIVASSSSCEITPTQLRWSPFDLPADGEKVDFVQGIKTVSVAGDPTAASGLAIHIYTANTHMDHKAFYNSDGDILIGMYVLESSDDLGC